MTQIKLSIAFVLAAAAIAPIVAQPIRDGNEFASNVVDLPHRHHHHHHQHPHPHHHHRHSVVDPEQLSLESTSEHRHHHRHHHRHVEQSPLEATSDATTPLSPREIVDEFEARGLLLGKGSILDSVENNVKALKHEDSQLEHQHKTLEDQNNHLKHTDGQLRDKERHLEKNDRRLQREGRKFKKVNHSLKKKVGVLSDRKHRLLKEDNKLGRKRRTLARQDNALEGEHRALLHKNKDLGRKDKFLDHERKALVHHNGVPASEGHGLAEKNRHLAHNDKAKIVAREDFESDEMFEREDVASIVRSLPRPLFNPLFGHGPAVPRLGLGHGPVRLRPFSGLGWRNRVPGLNRPLFRPRMGLALGPARRQIGPREYAVESDDMFERDFEDLEFDARDFDDELNLD